MGYRPQSPDYTCDTRMDDVPAPSNEIMKETYSEMMSQCRVFLGRVTPT